MQELIIIGASTHGRVISEIAIQQGMIVKFWDDNLFIYKKIGQLKIERRKNNTLQNSKLIFGIGDNKTREKLSSEYFIQDFISIIHDNSIVSESAIIGNGSLVMAGAILCSNSKVGEHCILNTGSVIEHDCVIESFVHVSPNATLCGNVLIGKGTWVGAGSTVIQGVKVGENVIIGAGAVIIEDIPNGATVVGNPGKVIKID